MLTLDKVVAVAVLCQFEHRTALSASSLPPSSSSTELATVQEIIDELVVDLSKRHPERVAD